MSMESATSHSDPTANSDEAQLSELAAHGTAKASKEEKPKKMEGWSIKNYFKRL